MAQNSTRTHVIWPVLLIVVGVLLLLANLGFLPPVAWRAVGFLWPVILVVLGVELLATRRVSWAGILGAIVALLILAILAGALGLGARFGERGLGSSVDVQLWASAAQTDLR